MKYPQLNKAPIKEAIIAIPFKFQSELEISELENFHNEIKDNLPRIDRTDSFSHKFKIDRDKISDEGKNNIEFESFLFSTEERELIVRLSYNSFSVHLKGLYQSYEAFESVAVKYWEKFNNYFKVLVGDSVSLRYINEIVLKTPFELSEYFNWNLPGIRDRDDNIIYNFFSKYKLVKSDSGSNAVVTLLDKNMPKDDEENITILFDIDTRKNINDDNIWDSLKVLRNVKNEIFFNAISENFKKQLER